MRSFLLAACPILLWVIAAFQLVMLILFFRKYAKTKNALYLLSGLVACGLFYDSLILSLGSVLQEGALLKTLSQVRYISHGGLIPLLLPICAYALDFKKVGKTVVWVITAVLIALGLGSGIVTSTYAESVAVVRYACDAEATPGWAYTVSTAVLAYGMVIPLVLAGIAAWIKQKTPALFLSGFLMFAFSALGPATGNFDLIFFISMFGEVCMVLFFMIYANFNQKHKA